MGFVLEHGPYTPSPHGAGNLPIGYTKPGFGVIHAVLDRWTGEAHGEIMQLIFSTSRQMWKMANAEVRS